MAMLYLMHKEGVSDEQALSRIRATRPQADPNPTFKRQLKEVRDVMKLDNTSN